ncbi:SRPBCC domain-containing protein [Streptomyces mutabilis]|uniref:SRPBCC domain-containing protein n=1 Tax=Streptomyces mutabilis TaxID=67332 RepID=UPI001F23AB97|nr:SRPBCC domain-containing protein [Streptomyces mutabilis]
MAEDVSTVAVLYVPPRRVRGSLLAEPGADSHRLGFHQYPEGVALWPGPGAVLTPQRGTFYRTTEGVTGEVRGYRPADRVRVTHGTTTVQVALTAAADGARTTLRFRQEHLASAEERERQRAHWQHVMDQVVTVLDRQ